MVKISFIPPALPVQGAVALTVAAEGKLGSAGAKLDKKLGGVIRKAISASGSFTGKKGQLLTIVTPAKTRLTKLVLVGIGKPADAKDITFQHAGGAAAVALLNGKDTQAVLLVDEHAGTKLSVAEAQANIAFGAKLRSYRFDKYRTSLKADQKPTLKTISVAGEESAAARRSYQSLEMVAEGVFFTRDLVSEPANVIYPETLAQQCANLKSLGVKVEILDEKQLKKLGMGSLLGVAQGSVHPARVVAMSWLGNPKAKDKSPVVFVGKGVTFDTGGISLKPPSGMEDMKWDMAGAGAVIGAMRALAGRKAKANVIGVVGLVENMPSGNAQRPGDVVTSMSGQTIEVINTDAEGRLVLADVIWYAQEKFKPSCVIDLATLTGAIIVALGHEYAGLFSNDDKLAKNLYRAGEAVEENLWRFPMSEAFDRHIDSSIADMKNTGSGREAGSIAGAQFIQRFVKKGIPWAHLDIAGMAWQNKDKPVCPKGASAFGVRLLDRFVADNYEA